jgi:aspartyl-tRNA(Asn)/glutamyl-tRNA(Gln) amidotransferase subunit B
MEFEAVIGLEVHVQLKTESKMFTRCPSGFGAAPNELTDPVVWALPGVLPVMNKLAIDRIIQMGLLLKCQIADECKWDRKNYWYPDSPKNYQITQFDRPICIGGEVEIELPGPTRNIEGPHRVIELTRIHLEEDVGKLTHFEDYSLVDYNRAGTPLAEIVSEPVIRSADEAFAYLTALRIILSNAGVSDCDMEKGQMRCDANISVRPVGDTKLGTKVELKNLNTISGVRNGVEYEIRRQVRLCKEGKREQIVQETRRWNADLGYTISMRGKENSHDYRYFPDPDLMPVRVDAEWKASLAATLPELPFDRQRRYQKDFELPYTLTSVLIPDLTLCKFFEETVALCGKPIEAANLIANELLRELSAAGTIGEGSLSIAESPVQPRHIASLVQAIESGVISRQIGKDVFVEMFKTGEEAGAIIERKGLKQTQDTGEIEALCREAIAGNAKAVSQFREGNEKAINALKGPVMKATKGKANPELLDAILRKLIAG